MSTLAAADVAKLARWRWRSLWIGVAALIACAVGAPSGPTQFFRAYLAAYIFYLGLGLGAMVILMIYHMTGGSWGFLTRRILEAQMRTLPLLALLFVPIACGLPYLYVWAQPEAVAASKELQYKQFYLQPTYFWIRSGVYFILWLALAWILTSWSRKQDRGGNSHLRWKYAKLGGIGAVIYGISIHFASVDWVMSLQPAFRSTVFGPLVALGQILSAHAFAVIVLVWLIARPPLGQIASRKVLNDLGNLLLAFLCTWAYLAWFQYMLIWIANLPADVIWYLPRQAGGWLWVVWAIVLLHFAVPFFLLLPRSVKQNPCALASVAALILCMHLVFDYYQVLPAFPADAISQHWMDFLTPLGLGGIWLAWFLWQLGRWPLLAQHDFNQREALRLRELDRAEEALEEALAHG